MTVRGHSVEAWFDDTQAAPFADGDGLAWVAARQRFEPAAGGSGATGQAGTVIGTATAAGDPLVVTLTLASSVWGIHDGQPYFDADGAVAGEEAVLMPDLTIIPIGG